MDSTMYAVDQQVHKHSIIIILYIQMVIIMILYKALVFLHLLITSKHKT